MAKGYDKRYCFIPKVLKARIIENETSKKKFPLLAGIFIVAGLSLLGFSIYVFIKSRKGENVFPWKK